MRAAARLSEAFLTNRPQEAARVLERLPLDDLSGFLAGHDAGTAAPVVQCMAPGVAAACLAAMARERASALLAALPFDVQVMVLRVLEAADRDALLAGLEAEVRESAYRRLRYPEGTAGALMDPSQVTVPSDMTAGAALQWVKTARGPSGHYTYVIDRGHRLVGVVTLSELLRADPQTPVQTLMRSGVVRLPAAMSQEDVLRNPYWREFRALPVVDGEERFLGAIRYQTAQALRDRFYRVRRNDPGVLGPVLAVGELVWVGLAGLLASVERTPERTRHGR